MQPLSCEQMDQLMANIKVQGLEDEVFNKHDSIFKLAVDQRYIVKVYLDYIDSIPQNHPDKIACMLTVLKKYVEGLRNTNLERKLDTKNGVDQTFCYGHFKNKYWAEENVLNLVEHYVVDRNLKSSSDVLEALMVNLQSELAIKKACLAMFCNDRERAVQFIKSLAEKNNRVYNVKFEENESKGKRIRLSKVAVSTLSVFFISNSRAPNANGSIAQW